MKYSNDCFSIDTFQKPIGRTTRRRRSLWQRQDEYSSRQWDVIFRIHFSLQTNWKVSLSGEKNELKYFARRWAVHTICWIIATQKISVQNTLLQLSFVLLSCQSFDDHQFWSFKLSLFIAWLHNNHRNIACIYCFVAALFRCEKCETEKKRRISVSDVIGPPKNSNL